MYMHYHSKHKPIYSTQAVKCLVLIAVILSRIFLIQTPCVCSMCAHPVSKVLNCFMKSCSIS